MAEAKETLDWLQAIIDRSAATAGPAVRRNFGGDWAMSAAEFVEFWQPGRMASVSTVSASGRLHTVPLDPEFVGGRFYLLTSVDSQRLKDHRANPRCSICAWDGPYRAVIIYGVAREVPTVSGEAASVEPAGPGGEGAMVTIEITPQRVYGIRPPPGHRPGKRLHAEILGPDGGEDGVVGVRWVEE